MTSGSARILSSPPRSDITIVTVSVFPGCSIATSWAIIPPIEAPTTWAASMPSASSSPVASEAMSFRL